MHKHNYEIRTYREQFNTQRFMGFQISFRETDLWIGVDRNSFRKEMKELTLSRISELRKILDKYIEKEPLFATSLDPFHPGIVAPAEAKEMALTSGRAGTLYSGTFR